MQLTRHTDYALRLLMHLAAVGDGQSRIAAAAQAQAVSRTHLMKIANRLARAGFITAVRGRGGGIRLARPAAHINLGAVIAAMEPPGPLVNCEECRLTGQCGLPAVLDKAGAAFRAVLQRYSLADICRGSGPPG